MRLVEGARHRRRRAGSGAHHDERAVAVDGVDQAAHGSMGSAVASPSTT